MKKFLELVKFEHTAFALPFAYLGMMMARRGWPEFDKFFWVTAAMVGARTAGMTLNRLVDLKIDAKNPRTNRRPLVTGVVTPKTAWFLAAGSAALFFVSAGMLNPLCLFLSPVALVLLTGYHYVKRWSHLCHFTLGAVLAVAPVGGWIGMTGSFDWQVVPLAAAVLFWVAGFDILYALQDIEFDRAEGLHSVPAKYGTAKALRVAASCHLATVAFLALFGLVTGLGALYWTGVLVTAGLLRLEHGLISEDDLSRINTAFFTINGWIGILLLIFTFLDIYR